MERAPIRSYKDLICRFLKVEQKTEDMIEGVVDFDDGTIIARRRAAIVRARSAKYDWNNRFIGWHEGEAYFVKGSEPDCSYIEIDHDGPHFIYETTTRVEKSRDGKKVIKAKK